MPVSRKPKRSPPAAATSAKAPPQLPDRRAMEAFLAQITGQRGDSALDAAQDVIYDAWDSTSRAQRIKLAQKALSLSPLCADAYVLLAQEQATSPAEALDLYQRGVEAGELALGPDAFVEDVGHFWGLLETRPYMRARHGLAMALWALGRHDDAIGHYQDMLRLNPGDNQGIRYMLLNALLDLGRAAEIEALLNRYGEDSAAAWLWGKVLFTFRRHGDNRATCELLAEAHKQNPHVVDYLLGRKPLPAQRPDYITWRGEDEVQECVRDARGAWQGTPGALAWVEALACGDRLSPTPLPRRTPGGKRTGRH